MSDTDICLATSQSKCTKLTGAHVECFGQRQNGQNADTLVELRMKIRVNAPATHWCQKKQPNCSTNPKEVSVVQREGGC